MKLEIEGGKYLEFHQRLPEVPHLISNRPNFEGVFGNPKRDGMGRFQFQKVAQPAEPWAYS